MIHGMHCVIKPRSSELKTGTLGRSALHVTSAIGVALGSVCRSSVPGYYRHNPPPLGFHKRPAGAAFGRQ